MLEVMKRSAMMLGSTIANSFKLGRAMRRPVREFRNLLVPLIAVGCVSLVGCKGQIGINADDPNGPFADNPNDPDNPDNPDDPDGPGTIETPDGRVVEPTFAHLRRLTPPQFENTVRAALGEVYAPDDLPVFGDDIPTIGLNNDPSSLRINDVNVQSLYDSSQALAAAAIANNPAVSSCVAASDDTCFTSLIDDIGSKLWRRPVTDEERDDITTSRGRVAMAGGTRAEQAEFVLMVMIASPNTLYRKELGVTEDGVQRLTDFELASALSYTLWNAPPDQELYDLAAAGELTNPEVLRAQAQRMAQDPRIADSFTEFFVDYLKVEALFSKNKLDELGLTPAARAALVEGIRRDLHAMFSMPGASLLDPFYSTSFNIDGESATFFGVNVAQGGEYEVVATDPNERLGVLSHPAFLSTHAGEGDSGIVKRGVFTLEQLLCVHLGAPPADISESEDVPPGFDDATATSREVLSVRHSSQAECVGCHSAIDPAGFGFENWDSAGRFRLVEKGNVQIDAGGTLNVNQETLSFTNSVDYVDTLAGSEALRSCLTNKYFTYVLGDEPRQVERELLYTAFDESDGALDVLVQTIVDTPSFTARNQQEDQ